MTAHYNNIKSWVAMAEATQEEYQKPPPPVDFAAAKAKVRDQELVDTLKTFYESNTPPPEVHEWPAAEQEKMEHHLTFLRELDAFNKEALPVLEKELEFQTANKTSVNTTMLDMKCNYPAIHEEIEDEIERREWFKDTSYDTGSSKAAAAH
jgi:hypothetical protein